MDDDKIMVLQNDIKSLKKSMKEIQVKQIVNNDTLDKITNEIIVNNKKHHLFYRHYIILIGLSTLCMIVITLLCHMGFI